jgi:hypothetical protein
MTTSTYQQDKKATSRHRAVANQGASRATAHFAVSSIQRKGTDDEELQLKSITQLATPEEDELQMKSAGEPKNNPVGEVSQRKDNASLPGANKTGIPDHLKTGIENLSGIYLDDVKVHYNSDKPAQLNALAYAQGTDIHVAPGQERHLPHEAWHVVQQKQGRVRPTIQAKGVAINDDRGLEHEADVMGGKAVRCLDNILKPIAQKELTMSPKHSYGETQLKTFHHISDTKAQPYFSAERISNMVVQKVGFLDYLTGNLNEDEKDQFYFSRSSWNPLNWSAQIQNEAFENNNTAYHSTSVHGAQNTLTNIRNRHYANPGGPANMSQMQNTLTGAVGTIRRQPNSSRFASSSWEKHARNDAMNSFSLAAQGLGFNVTWNNAPPAFGAPGVGQSTSMFFISYTNGVFGDYEVGVTSQSPAIGPPNPSGATNAVKVTINYYQVPGNQISAWIGQMFPVPAATPAVNHGIVQVANVNGTAWSLSDFNLFG